MDASFRWTSVWRHLGRADKVLLAALAAYWISGWLGTGSAARFVLLLLVVATAAIAGVKWMRIGIRKAIWRLRNRLLVAYLFIGLVPILLIATLAIGASWALASQIAVHLVSSELDRRVAALDESARSMARVPQYQRERAWQRAKTILGQEFPNLEVLVEERGVVRFPAQPAMEPPPEGWGETSGVVVNKGLLYTWARAIAGETEVTMMAPLTRQFLISLSPGLGGVTILEFSDRATSGDIQRPAMRPYETAPGEAKSEGSALPPPSSRFDYDFKQGTSIPVAIWESPPARTGGLLSVHSRFSAVLNAIFSQKTESGQILFILYVLALVFLVVELISLFIGVNITRTITSAFNDLYEGTERVRKAEFSHRIEVHGDDQIAEVSESFNRMTENLERLMVVAKEKERMQAELEIAREVQRQLYPKSVPALARLELCAQCNPARMVSGDYYDYQALCDGHAVVAIGDVAGKGISAALLMATLQSSLRTQIRAALESGAGGNGGESGTISTSRLVGQLNEQIYADTSPEKYATFYFSVYNDETGVLTYTNAGHLPPILVRNGNVTRLDVNGMVVGAFPFAEYGESRLQFEGGDLLLAYTDGITEPENEYGEMFGEQRVIDLVVRNAHRDAGHIITTVMDAVQEWTGSPELQDDMTILVARRH